MHGARSRLLMCMVRLSRTGHKNEELLGFARTYTWLTGRLGLALEPWPCSKPNQCAHCALSSPSLSQEIKIHHLFARISSDAIATVFFQPNQPSPCVIPLVQMRSGRLREQSTVMAAPTGACRLSMDGASKSMPPTVSPKDTTHPSPSDLCRRVVSKHHFIRKKFNSEIYYSTVLT
jgi:hypothetical protein